MQECFTFSLKISKTFKLNITLSFAQNIERWKVKAICEGPRAFNSSQALTFLKNWFASIKSFKNDENCFLLHAKSLFHSSDIYVISWLFGYVENGLMRKLQIISKFMTSQTEQQIITIHIFHNISGSNGKHRMKFDQLIKYNLRNIVLEKLYTKNVGETSPKVFFVICPSQSLPKY